jgi:hypothetical protein
MGDGFTVELKGDLESVYGTRGLIDQIKYGSQKASPEEIRATSSLIVAAEAKFRASANILRAM